MNLITEEGFEKATQMFERAIAEDPTYDRPYVGLANVYVWRAFISDADAPDNWTKAKTYAERALALDESLAEAHSLIGTIKLFHEWDWVGAREALERARSLNPNSPPVREDYGKLLLITGQIDEGIAESKTALALHPLSHGISCGLVGRYYDARRFDSAVEHGVNTADKFPTCPYEQLGVGGAFIQKGMYDDAISHIEASMNIRETAMALARLASAYALSGRESEAQAVLDRLHQRDDFDPYLGALVMVAMGDRNRAFEELEAAYEKRSSYLPGLNIEPAFDPIRGDRRFADLVKRIGLPSS
jgi:tetratricopeptide (TPR) repeat protein